MTERRMGERERGARGDYGADILPHHANHRNYMPLARRLDSMPNTVPCTDQIPGRLQSRALRRAERARTP